MSGESLSSPRRINAKERQKQALQLRIAGASFQAIADSLGYSNASGAYKAVMKGLLEITREPAEQLLAIELERTDMALLAIANAVRRGDLFAIDRWDRLINTRAKLLGIAKPQKIALTDPSGENAAPGIKLYVGVSPDDWDEKNSPEKG